MTLAIAESVLLSSDGAGLDVRVQLRVLREDRGELNRLGGSQGVVARKLKLLTGGDLLFELAHGDLAVLDPRLQSLHDQ